MQCKFPVEIQSKFIYIPCKYYQGCFGFNYETTFAVLAFLCWHGKSLNVYSVINHVNL